jgi:hypothetical protein
LSEIQGKQSYQQQSYEQMQDSFWLVVHREHYVDKDYDMFFFITEGPM